MEVADDQINDEAAVDAALEDQSVMTGSESEMSSNDQVISMLVGETYSVCWRQFRHCQTLPLLPLETIPSTRWVGSKSPLQHHLCQIHRQQKLSKG